MKHGCCMDGITPCKGKNYEGCNDREGMMVKIGLYKRILEIVIANTVRNLNCRSNKKETKIVMLCGNLRVSTKLETSIYYRTVVFFFKCLEYCIYNVLSLGSVVTE